MDLDPGLRYAARRIYLAIEKYAEKEGWLADSYHILMAINTKWDTFHVEVVASGFDKAKLDDRSTYEESLDHLESEMSDEPEIYEAIGLILEPLGPGPFPIRRSSGENTVLLDETSFISGSNPTRGQISYP